MNRFPTTGDVIQLPNVRGDVLVVDTNDTPEGKTVYGVRAIKADKVTGLLNDKDTTSWKISTTMSDGTIALNDVRLIGQAKFTTQVTKTYKITKRKDIV